MFAKGGPIEEMVVKSLTIQHSTALPIREISALTTRARESGAELLAVGDEDFAVIAAALDTEHRPARTWRHDLCRVLPREYLDSDSGSGFEGIASDGEGTIFVLQEEEARILVLSGDLKELLQTIHSPCLRTSPATEPHGVTPLMLAARR